MHWITRFGFFLRQQDSRDIILRKNISRMEVILKCDF